MRGDLVYEKDLNAGGMRVHSLDMHPQNEAERGLLKRIADNAVHFGEFSQGGWYFVITNTPASGEPSGKTTLDWDEAKAQILEGQTDVAAIPGRGRVPDQEPPE
jgi:hypothetical protein